MEDHRPSLISWLVSTLLKDLTLGSWFSSHAHLLPSSGLRVASMLMQSHFLACTSSQTHFCLEMMATLCSLGFEMTFLTQSLFCASLSPSLPVGSVPVSGQVSYLLHRFCCLLFM